MGGGCLGVATEMKRLALLVGLGAAAAAWGTADAQEGTAPSGEFDNPALGSVPCVVLNRYDVSPAGQANGTPQFKAYASVENICGRTLDLEFCFTMAESEEGEAARNCYGAALRPWTSAEVNKPGGPARVVGTDYRWRYIPVGP